MVLVLGAVAGKSVWTEKVTLGAKDDARTSTQATELGQEGNAGGGRMSKVEAVEVPWSERVSAVEGGAGSATTKVDEILGKDTTAVPTGLRVCNEG